jgi:hypothetical protein
MGLGELGCEDVPCIQMVQTLVCFATSTSETSVNFYQTTRRNFPDDSHLYTRPLENLKSNLTMTWILIRNIIKARRSTAELLHVGRRIVVSFHHRADVFETGEELRFRNNPHCTRGPAPICLRGPAIQFHKRSWRVHQDKGKVTRATYSHPH